MALDTPSIHESYRNVIEQEIWARQDYACTNKATARHLASELFGYLEPVWPQFWPEEPWEAFRSAQSPSLSSHLAYPEFPCYRILQRNDAVYCCRDCANEECGYVCANCFRPQDHMGHNVTFHVHIGGPTACACNDQESFKVPWLCPTHPRRTAPPAAVPENILQQLRISVSFSVQYLVNALQNMPTLAVPPKIPQDIFKQLDPLGPPSQDGENRQGPWALLLWNDEKHSYDQVITQVCKAIPAYTREAAYNSATHVDEYGRALVLLSNDVKKLHDAARVIHTIDLAVNIRSVGVTYMESVSGLMVDWLVLLSRTPHPEVRFLIAEELLRTMDDIKCSAFQFLLMVDARMWKRIRLQLRYLFTALMATNSLLRLQMGSYFMDRYGDIINAYLFFDREPEYSLLQMSPQLFVVPSVAGALVKNQNAIVQITAILAAFFGEQIDVNTRSLIFPAVLADLKIDPESPAFKHKRYTYVFADLCRLLATLPVKRYIVQTPQALDTYATFIALFTGMNPNQRASNIHLEYESEVWVSAFNLIMNLAKSCKPFAKSYTEGSLDDILKALSIIIQRIWDMTDRQVALASHAAYGERALPVSRLAVSKDFTSFHHPLTWLFAEVAKNTQLLAPSNMAKQSAYESVTHWMRTSMGTLDTPERLLLAVADRPLQVLSLLAQIRAGLWVRNGFGVRAQALHYRDSSLREFTYEQDLYALQVVMALFDKPADLLIAIMHTFEILEWFKHSRTTHPIFDATQVYSIAEDFFNLLITLLSERSNICHWSAEHSIRRDLIHALALGSCSRSELSKRTNDRISEDPLFDRILAEVARFRAPVGTNETGIYYLHPHLHAELDPYYFRYTRNQRDECLRAIKEHSAKDQGDPPLILPLHFEMSELFQPLKSVYGSPIFVEMLTHSLIRVCAETDKDSLTASETDVFVDGVLQLTMLALVHAPQAFAEQAVRTSVHNDWPARSSTFLSALSAARVCKATEQARAKIMWCQSQLQEILGPLYPPTTPLSPSTPGSGASDASGDAKKAAVKARQAAIMEQFKNARQAFFDNPEYDMEDDEDEDMDVEGDKSVTLKSVGSCIVCSEDLNSSQPFGALVLIQTSRLLRTLPRDGHLPLDSVDNLDHPLDLSLPSDDVILKPILSTSSHAGLHATHCDHMMHLDCFDTYCHSAELRQLAAPHRRHPEELGRREYVCPLCKSLGNILLPVDADDQFEDTLPTSTDEQQSHDLDNWLFVRYRQYGADRWNSNIAPLLSPTGSGLFRSLFASEDLPNSNPFVRNVDNSSLESQKPMLERFQEVVWPLSLEAHPEALDRSPILPAQYMPEELVAYTVMSMEVASRGSQVDSSAEMVTKRNRLIKGLLRVCRNLVDIGATSLSTTNLATEALAMRILPTDDIAGPRHFRTPLLCQSPLSFLVEAAALARPEDFSAFVNFAYYLEVVRTFIVIQYYDWRSWIGQYSTTAPLTLSETPLDAFLGQLVESQSWTNAFQPSSWTKHILVAAQLLQMTSLPFLRQASILQEAIGYNTSAEPQNASETPSEYLTLLRRLRIVNPDYLARSVSASNPENAISVCIQSWLSHYSQRRIAALIPKSLDFHAVRLFYPLPYRMVPLPRRLDALINHVSSIKCNKCRTIPVDPALCLLCGAIVCHQSMCCMERDASEEGEPLFGECNAHMWKWVGFLVRLDGLRHNRCGGSSAAYLLTKRCSLLYLHAGRGSYFVAPYHDVHGEPDQGQKRHRLQYFFEPAYEQIRQHWIRQTIPAAVARKLEATQDNGGWQTL